VEATKCKVYSTCVICEQNVVDEEVDEGCVKCDPPVPVCSSCIEDYAQCGGCKGKMCEECIGDDDDVWQCFDCVRTFCGDYCGDKKKCVVCDGDTFCSDCAVGL